MLVRLSLQPAIQTMHGFADALATRQRAVLAARVQSILRTHGFRASLVVFSGGMVKLAPDLPASGTLGELERYNQYPAAENDPT
jgi:hypothetical protein